MNENIFKNYDVRGIYGSEFKAADVEQMADAYLRIVCAELNKAPEKLQIALGRDIRHASQEIHDIFGRVLTNFGVKIIDLGLISMNDFYFAAGFYKFDGGVMATASHNPPEYGGCKMTVMNQEFTDSIQFISGKKLWQELQQSPLKNNPRIKPGKIITRDVIADHLKHVLSFVQPESIKPFRLIVDIGNGMTGRFLSQLAPQFPCEFIFLHPEPDGNFPNRAPNPLAKNASDIASKNVVSQQADLGVMFDADGDRMFLLDENGLMVPGDLTLLLLAKMVLRKYPRSGIVYNLICSHAVPELVTRWGGIPIRSEVGYLNLAYHMHRQGGVMSGEVSGHYAFKNNYYADNAFIALVLALQAISEDGRRLSEIIKEFALYYRADEINFVVKDALLVLNKVRELYHDNVRDEIDGLTVEFADWWFNLRASNTEPLLRLTIEAGKQSEFARHRDELVALINS